MGFDFDGDDYLDPIEEDELMRSLEEDEMELCSEVQFYCFFVKEINMGLFDVVEQKLQALYHRCS